MVFVFVAVIGGQAGWQGSNSGGDWGVSVLHPQPFPVAPAVSAGGRREDFVLSIKPPINAPVKNRAVKPL